MMNNSCHGFSRLGCPDRDEAEMVADEFLYHGYHYQIQVKVIRKEEDFLML
jgi:hypothetical protein